MESKFLNGEGVRHLNHRLQVRNALDRINIIDVNNLNSVTNPDPNCIYRISNCIPMTGSVDKICFNKGLSSEEFFNRVLNIPENQWVANSVLDQALELEHSSLPDGVLVKYYIICQTTSLDGLAIVQVSFPEGIIYGLLSQHGVERTQHWSGTYYKATSSIAQHQWDTIDTQYAYVDGKCITYQPEIDLPTGAYNSLFSEFISIDMDFNTSAAYAVTNGYEWQIFNEGIDQLETRTNTLETKTNTLGTKINTLETKVNTLQASSGVLNLRELRLEEQIGKPKTISDDMVNSIMKATQVCVGESNYSVILTISGTRGGGNNVYFTGWHWPANGYSPIPAYLLLNADNKTVVFSGI